MTLPEPPLSLGDRLYLLPAERREIREYGKACAAAERERINALLAAVREHWITVNGKDSLSVGALDVIAEVIADGSYVPAAAIREAPKEAP